MDLTGMLGGLLQQYAGGATPTGAAADAAHDHFDQAAKGLDLNSLASGITAMMKSSDTPGFGQMMGQMFGSANGDQKAGMLNTILASASPAVLGQLSALIPGLAPGATVTPAQAQAIPPAVVQQAATQAEQHNPGILDSMGSLFANHPTLVKTLGTGAVIVALRELGKRIPAKN